MILATIAAIVYRFFTRLFFYGVPLLTDFQIQNVSNQSLPVMIDLVAALAWFMAYNALTKKKS